MTGIREKLKKVSKEVDDYVQKARKEENVNNIEYKEMCEKIFDAYVEAGSSGDLSLSPKEGRAWLEEQNAKMSDLIKWMVDHHGFKTGRPIYDDKGQLIGLELKWNKDE